MSDWQSQLAPAPDVPTAPSTSSWQDQLVPAGPTPQQKAVVSANDNGDEAANALKIAKQTGIPASVVNSDLPGYDAHARTQAAIKAVNNPYIAQYVDGHPMAAKVSSDDYEKLDEVSQYLQNLHQDKVNGQAHVGLIQAVPEIADLLTTAPGRAKLADTWQKTFGTVQPPTGLPILDALRQLSTSALAQGMIDFVKVPGGVQKGDIDLNTPQGMDTAVGTGVAIALGMNGKINVGRAPLPKGTVSFDEFMSTLRGMQTRAEIDAFLRSKAEGETPPGAMLAIEKAKAGGEALDAAVEKAQESKTKIRSPDMFEDFAAAHGDESLHIDANKVMELYQKEGKVPAEGDGLLGFIPDLAAKAQDAAATGGEVTVPLSKYLAHVDPAVHEGLKDSVRLHDDGVTTVEAEEAQKSIEAYHGTPHDFESFNLQKINTGEGAQVYGHGLYFAENASVAQDYQTKLGLAALNLHDAQVIDRLTKQGKTDQEIISYLEQRGNLYASLELEAYKKNPKGHLYKVSISADPTHFLDWDKPLSEQSSHVQEAIKKLEPGYSKLLETNFEDYSPSQRDKGPAKGEALVRDLTENLGAEQASKALSEAGIPGIRYLDQDSRFGGNKLEIKEYTKGKFQVFGKGTGAQFQGIYDSREEAQVAIDKYRAKATRNFVLFDDKLVKITEKNGAAVAEVAKVKKDLFLNQLFQDAKSVGLTDPEFKKYSDKIENANKAMIQKSIERDVARRTAPEWKKNEAAIKAEVEAAHKTKLETNIANWAVGMSGGADVSVLPEAVETLGAPLKKATTFYRGEWPGRPERGVETETTSVSDRAGGNSFGLMRNDHELEKFDTPEGARVPISEIKVPVGTKVLDASKYAGANAGELETMLPPGKFVKTGERLEKFDLSGASGKYSYLISTYEFEPTLAPDFAKVIKDEVAAQMEARYGNRRANIQQEARELALSDDWHGILADEVRILADAAGVKPALGQREMVQWAKDSFEASNIVDAANWEKHRRAVERGGKEAEKALLKGDFLEALKAKQRQMLAAVRAKEAIKLQKDIDTAEKKIDRFSSNEVIKSIDQAHLEQLRQLLASVGVPQQFAPLEGTVSMAQFVADAEGQIAAAPWLMNGRPPKLTDMTVEQFRAFANTMKSLEHVGRLAKTVENARGKAELANVVFDAKKELERFPFIEQPSTKNTMTLRQKVASTGRYVLGAHLLVEKVLDYTDGFNPHGPLTEYLDRPLRDSNNKEIVLTEKVTAMLRDLHQFVDASINEMIDNTLIRDAGMKSGFMPMARQNLRELMRHTGNASNMQKVLDGFGITEADLRKFIDDNATAKDVAWVNGIWKIYDFLKPEADAMQLRDTGVPVDTIPSVPWEIKAGKLNGGYARLVYDRTNSDIVGTMAAKDPIFANNYVAATTPHGYTKERTAYEGAIDLNGTHLASSLRGMIHDIAFRESVRNANKLISNQELRTAIAQYWGKEVLELLPGWLKDIANSHNIDENYARGIVKAASLVRQNTIATLVNYNPGTYIKHGFTAALMSANRVGLLEIASAVRDIGLKGQAQSAKDLLTRVHTTDDEAAMQAFRDALDQGERGENARQFMLNSSAVMRNRTRQRDDSIAGAVDAMNNIGLRKLMSDTRQTSMLLGRFAIAYSDSLSAGATWGAAYKTAYRAGESHDDAVFIADREVSRTHGSNFVGDQPAVTRLPNTGLGELGRWFTPFYRFWNHMFNMQLQLAWDAAALARGPKEIPSSGGSGPPIAPPHIIDMKQGPSGEWNYAAEPGANAKAISGKLLVILGAMFIEEQATAPLNDNGHGHLMNLLLASVRMLGGGIVGLREATNGLANGYEPSVGMLGTIVRAGTEIAKDIAKSTSAKATVSKNWLIHTANTIGILTGVGGSQVGKTGTFIKNRITGRDVPQGTGLQKFNAFRQGLRTGHSQARKF